MGMPPGVAKEFMRQLEEDDKEEADALLYFSISMLKSQIDRLQYQVDTLNEEIKLLKRNRK